MIGVSPVATRALRVLHGTFRHRQLNVQDPNKLVVGLHVSILVTIHCDFHAVGAIVSAPIIAAAKVAVALKRKLDVANLFLLLRADRLQRGAMSLARTVGIAFGPKERLARRTVVRSQLRYVRGGRYVK